MKTRNKGFTLVELLAVIVILAIIALIATPAILNVIEKARKGAAESSALGYIDAVEKQIMINELDTAASKITDNVYKVSDLNKAGVTVKGDKPEDNSLVKIERGQVVDYSLEIGNYVVNYDEEKNKASATKGGTLKTELGGSAPIKKGPTKVVAQATETHKGIVYLNPTNLDEYCDASNSISTTETKTGCMKWYIFNDNGDNYTMILDHNTTARIKWNDSNSNVAYESSNLKAVVDDLVTTSGWKVTPRLITAKEVSKIVDKENWTNTSSWYCLDSKEPDSTNWCSKAKGTSNYKWLFEHTYDCENYGCDTRDNTSYTGVGTAGNGGTYGYWTSTTYDNAGSGSNVWVVSRAGALLNGSAYSTDYGVRPVITISKSIVS